MLERITLGFSHSEPTPLVVTEMRCLYGMLVGSLETPLRAFHNTKEDTPIRRHMRKLRALKFFLNNILS
jgi:hypothetical protein